jgi:hypothetical protein
MGEIAAAALLNRITESSKNPPNVIYVDPELVIRETTAPVVTQANQTPANQTEAQQTYANQAQANRAGSNRAR